MSSLRQVLGTTVWSACHPIQALEVVSQKIETGGQRIGQLVVWKPGVGLVNLGTFVLLKGVQGVQCALWLIERAGQLSLAIVGRSYNLLIQFPAHRIGFKLPVWEKDIFSRLHSWLKLYLALDIQAELKKIQTLPIDQALRAYQILFHTIGNQKPMRLCPLVESVIAYCVAHKNELSESQIKAVGALLKAPLASLPLRHDAAEFLGWMGLQMQSFIERMDDAPQLVEWLLSLIGGDQFVRTSYFDEAILEVVFRKPALISQLSPLQAHYLLCAYQEQIVPTSTEKNKARIESALALVRCALKDEDAPNKKRAAEVLFWGVLIGSLSQLEGEQPRQFSAPQQAVRDKAAQALLNGSQQADTTFLLEVAQEWLTAITKEPLTPPNCYAFFFHLFRLQTCFPEKQQVWENASNLLFTVAETLPKEKRTFLALHHLEHCAQNLDSSERRKRLCLHFLEKATHEMGTGSVHMTDACQLAADVSHHALHDEKLHGDQEIQAAIAAYNRAVRELDPSIAQRPALLDPHTCTHPVHAQAAAAEAARAVRQG